MIAQANGLGYRNRNTPTYAVKRVATGIDSVVTSSLILGQVFVAE